MTQWIRQSPRSLQMGLLVFALIALCFPVIQPLLRGQMPLTADGTLHLYRLVALDHALQGNDFQAGSLWMRYVPGLTYGYGAPMFNYYSPLSLYPGLVLHHLGMTYLNAWLWGMVLYTLVAVVGAYALGALWGGVIAGLVTAAAYLYAPYTLYDLLWRGTTAEYASLALLPLVFWSLTRLIQTRYGRYWLLTALLYAAFVPMHNVITLHGSVLLGFYGLVVWGMQRQPQTPLWRHLLPWMSALVVGLMLSAFFWLPAITETRYVKLDAITATLPVIDVVANLTDLDSIFALPRTADPTQLQPPLSISLGWISIILSIVGIVIAVGWRKYSALMRSTPRILWLMIFSIAATAFLVFMNTPASAGLWRILPLIRYSQFPWRLIGLASLLLALMAGIGAVLLIERLRYARAQLLLLAAIMIGLMLYGYPYLYPIYQPNVNPQTISDVQAYERDSGFVTTSSFGEYLPVWNEQMPDETALVAKFEQSDVIRRLRVPENVQVSSQRWGKTSATLDVEAETPTELVFEWFFFPGWDVKIDGQSVTFSPTPEEGLIAVTVPAGIHTVEISLLPTDIQRGAWAISGIGLMSVFVGAVLLRRSRWSEEQKPYLEELNAVRPPTRRNGKSGEFARPLRHPNSAYVLAVLAGVVVAIGLKVFAIDPGQTFIKRERFLAGDGPGVPVSIPTNFDQELFLIGSSFLPPAIASGDLLKLTLYWRVVDDAVSVDYSSVLTLRDPNDEIYAQLTDWQPGGLSTRHWQPGYYIAQPVELRIPPGTPPTQYTLEVSLYDPETTSSLEVLNEQGNPVSQSLPLQTVDVTLSGRPAAPEEVSSDVALNVDLPNAMRLIGINRLPTEASVGQPLSLIWVWQALQEQTLEAEAQLAWVEGEDIQAVSESIQLIAGVQAWRSGETLRGRHTLYIPGDLESGQYELLLLFEESSVPLGQMTVTAPERNFTMPEVTHPVDVRWQNGIQLVGYEITDSRILRLYWQSETPQHQNLNEFVHLVDANDVIVDQFAGVPSGGSRPITGWATGEIIMDEVPLTIPQDAALRLRVGWFDPRGGQRILLEIGDDDTTLDAYEIVDPD